MKIFTLLVGLLYFSFTGSAQWTQRAAFPGSGRTKATSFTIGDKIYLIGGIDASSFSLKDVWEYDITNDVWHQKSDFAGPERYGAVGFEINGLGYIATGGNDNGFLDDLWQYNPVNDTWLSRTGLPVGSAQHENQRREAFGFVINNKAYLGGGDGFVFGANQTWNHAFNDLWEYNPVSNSWTTKADIPDFLGRNMSIAVAINGKGYVGLGCNVDQNVNQPSFWEYDPTLNSWSAKLDFPSQFTTDANAFTLNSQLYVVGGVNLTPVALSSQVYKYDPPTDVWTAVSNFNGGSIAGAIGGSTSSTAFLGTGYTGALNLRTDFWEMNISTGIANEITSSNEAVRIYPNPISTTATISFNSEIKNGKIAILNSIGEKVRQIEINNSFATIDRIGLADGIYFYEVISNQGILSAGKFNIH